MESLLIKRVVDGGRRDVRGPQFTRLTGAECGESASSPNVRPALALIQSIDCGSEQRKSLIASGIRWNSVTHELLTSRFPGIFSQVVRFVENRTSQPGENGWINVSQSITDTRIFSRAPDRFWSYISSSYRGVRCLICSTMHDNAEPVYAKFTRRLVWRKDRFTMQLFAVEVGEIRTPTA